MPRPTPSAGPTGDAPRPPFKTRLLGRLIGAFVGGIGKTLRFEIDDRCGVLEKSPDGPMIWAFWHNRIFVIPTLWRKFLPERNGTALTSASKDGAIMAETLRFFGAGSVRGSSSRRGAAASRELVGCVEAGIDIGITPDGPRGPCYRLAPGLVRLASVTGAPILPVLVDYEKAWRMKSWDSFRIPKPFSKVRVTLLPFENLPPGLDGDDFEAERTRIESILGGDEPAAGDAPSNQDQDPTDE